jgi:hypothetical protein
VTRIANDTGTTSPHLFDDRLDVYHRVIATIRVFFVISGKRVLTPLGDGGNEPWLGLRVFWTNRAPFSRMKPT